MDKLSKKIIVLEGLPASGKTTLANYLSENMGYYKVNESMGKLSPQHITNSQIEIFTETLGKYGIAKTVDSNCIIDRGYPSLLCWDYCAEKLGYAKDYFKRNIWIKKSLGNGELFEPDLYVYLDIDPIRSTERRPRQTNKIDVWSGRQGMGYAREFYNRFFIGRSDVVRIDGELGVKEISQLIRQKLHDKN